MVTVAGRPGSGKSTLALDFARSAAVKHHKSTAIFSLEMGSIEIMMRLFSAEAGVALQSMRSGHMSDQDWTRLARRSSELADAPLYIDDSPNLTMMEIRAKARRLKQRNDLQLIVIDYLQLMTSGKRVESRQQEVSEFSPRDEAAGQGTRRPRRRAVASSTVVPSSAPTRSRCCRTCASPARSSRTRTW